MKPGDRVILKFGAGPGSTSAAYDHNGKYVKLTYGDTGTVVSKKSVTTVVVIDHHPTGNLEFFDRFVFLLSNEPFQYPRSNPIVLEIT